MCYNDDMMDTQPGAAVLDTMDDPVVLDIARQTADFMDKTSNVPDMSRVLHQACERDRAARSWSKRIRRGFDLASK